MTSGYSDQPMCIVRRPDSAWLCLTTYNDKPEGSFGERVVASVSTDRGRTWNGRVPLDPESVGVIEYAYAAPWQAQAPSTRIFGLYVINSDRISHLGNGKPITRTDMLGHFVFRYSDNLGLTWSNKSFEIPVRTTAIDRRNDFNGSVLMHWEVDHVSVVGSHVFVAFAKIGTYLVNPPTSVFFLHSPNAAQAGVAAEDITWETWPRGDNGVHSWPNFSNPSISEEGHIVVLHNYTYTAGAVDPNTDTLAANISIAGYYTVFRTTTGVLGAASSSNGFDWTVASPGATHWLGGQGGSGSRVLRNPRGPITPRFFARTKGAATPEGGAATENGQFLMLYYNNGMTGFTGGRNPYWLVPGWQVPTKSGGVTVEWGEPEVALFNVNAPPLLGSGKERGAGYPDFIEEPDAVYITETQKTQARVHRVDDALLAALFSQRFINASVPAAVDVRPGRTPTHVAMPPLRPIAPLAADGPGSAGGGFSCDFFLRGLASASAEAKTATAAVLLDSRSPQQDGSRSTAGAGAGIVVMAKGDGSVTVRMVDDRGVAANASLLAGSRCATWLAADTSPASSFHHLGIVVDGGPGIVTFVVDGIFCDGMSDVSKSDDRGWAVLDKALGNVTGSSVLHFLLESGSNGVRSQLLPPAGLDVPRARLYDRVLLTSEMIGNARAGPVG